MANNLSNLLTNLADLMFERSTLSVEMKAKEEELSNLTEEFTQLERQIDLSNKNLLILFKKIEALKAFFIEAESKTIPTNKLKWENTYNEITNLGSFPEKYTYDNNGEQHWIDIQGLLTSLEKGETTTLSEALSRLEE